MKRALLYCSVLLLMSQVTQAQKRSTKNLIYLDQKGVLRFSTNNREATFFGVNYTVPFAYGFRSHKALGIDPEKAIDADVYHMSRLGLNAFRVHVWDVEISDSLGNLLENEHLRLFDYLVKKLKEHTIKILITPIAFWGNGYPEPDTKTIGFASVYGKRPSVVREEAFVAQERYLQQFFKHVNPYTGLTYRDDPDVIAMEINNEPQHSGPKSRTTEYVQRMTAAVKKTGWSKPIFYNISESPAYADAVVRGNVDGHSFQWYPTGLVAGREIKGNLLPNVDQYLIPFGDTIAAFRNKALMVYEFDAGDVGQPIMYPAIARSFRTAGFGWATQFAYDPLYTAYANTEYQTHYLNLVYTPAKAISLLIAGKAFHRLPSKKSWGVYPADTLFDVFRVSYREGLSEMNSEDEFYYTGNTSTTPKNIRKLVHIAGVGSSSVVEYEGTGAYFLDKISDGVWMLEVMPDVIPISDAFAKASPKKEVVRIESRPQWIKINLPDFENSFSVRAESLDGSQKAQGRFLIPPGRYMLSPIGFNGPMNFPQVPDNFPKTFVTEPNINHLPWREVTAGKPFPLKAIIAGADTNDKISVEMHNGANQWKTVPMQRIGAYTFEAEVPKDMVVPGFLDYRIMIWKANGDAYSFPGGIRGNPYSWDEYRNESWQTFVASEQSPVEIFHATRDRNKIIIYNTDWRNNLVQYIAADDPGRLALKTAMNKPSEGQFMGWQAYVRDKVSGREGELSAFTKLVIKARSSGDLKAHLSLIDEDATAYGTLLALTKEWKTIEIPLSSLQKDSMLLLPRPYPGFQPLWFVSSSNNPFRMEGLEKLEVRFAANDSLNPVSVEVQWIRLKK